MTATVAVLSIGQMGLGIANLLIAHDFRVITNVSDRSAATQDRAKSSSIELLTSDTELVEQADYILSIVPPKDSAATAQRIITALNHPGIRTNKPALWFLDLNAGSPDTVIALSHRFATHAPSTIFLDGGIIGGPPRASPNGPWTRPGIPLAGPSLHDPTAPDGTRLAQVLNTRPLGPHIGHAKALKSCFAALTKGFTALALQSYTTASQLELLPELQFYLDAYNPGARDRAEKGIVGCTGKAYRWVEEMRLIGETFAVQGGFGTAQVFREIAGVYQGLAELAEKEERGLKSEDAEGVVGKLGRYLKEEEGEGGKKL